MGGGGGGGGDILISAPSLTPFPLDQKGWKSNPALAIDQMLVLAACVCLC